jgi:hypothetical protein
MAFVIIICVHLLCPCVCHPVCIFTGPPAHREEDSACKRTVARPKPSSVRAALSYPHEASDPSRAQAHQHAGSCPQEANRGGVKGRIRLN